MNKELLSINDILIFLFQIVTLIRSYSHSSINQKIINDSYDKLTINKCVSSLFNN